MPTVAATGPRPASPRRWTGAQDDRRTVDAGQHGQHPSDEGPATTRISGPRREIPTARNVCSTGTGTVPAACGGRRAAVGCTNHRTNNASSPLRGSELESNVVIAASGERSRARSLGSRHTWVATTQPPSASAPRVTRTRDDRACSCANTYSADAPPAHVVADHRRRRLDVEHEPCATPHAGPRWDSSEARQTSAHGIEVEVVWETQDEPRPTSLTGSCRRRSVRAPPTPPRISGLGLLNRRHE